MTKDRDIIFHLFNKSAGVQVSEPIQQEQPNTQRSLSHAVNVCNPPAGFLPFLTPSSLSANCLPDVLKTLEDSRGWQSPTAPHICAGRVGQVEGAVVEVAGFPECGV